MPSCSTPGECGASCRWPSSGTTPRSRSACSGARRCSAWPQTRAYRSNEGLLSHPFERAIPVAAADHLLGGEHAPVTIVEYGDFECPNCRQAAPAVKLILGHWRGRVRLVWRHFPLEGVHPHALSAALASEAAAAQGK